MKSRIRIVAIVLLALVGSMAPSVAADSPSFDEEWVQSAPATVGLIGINTQASVQALTYSSYFAFTSRNNIESRFRRNVYLTCR